MPEVSEHRDCPALWLLCSLNPTQFADQKEASNSLDPLECLGRLDEVANAHDFDYRWHHCRNKYGYRSGRILERVRVSYLRSFAAYLGFNQPWTKSPTRRTYVLPWTILLENCIGEFGPEDEYPSLLDYFIVPS